MFYLYKWSDLKKDSPHEQTRNRWLYEYGAFARYKGLWFPCKIVRYNTIGEPAVVTAIIQPNVVNGESGYPYKEVYGELSAYALDVLYTPFSDGRSISVYIAHALKRKGITDSMLMAALRRSLNTELLFGPKRLMRELKTAANRQDKEEAFVLNVTNKDEIGAVPLPRTIEIVEKLWNSNDWAMQEISQLLGISYNPAHGKKERMLQNELLGDRDLTIMNREMITNRLITAADKFGEKVQHISTEIDTIDRNLSYGKSPEQIAAEKEKEVEPDGNNSL